MPAPRAVLAEIARLGLDHKTPHKLVNGRLAARIAGPDDVSQSVPDSVPVHHGPLMPTTTHVEEPVASEVQAEPAKKKPVAKKKVEE